MKIEDLIQELLKYPQDAIAYAYEGEITGIIIRKNNEELGEIETPSL